MLEWNEEFVRGQMKWCLIENRERILGCDYDLSTVANAHRYIASDPSNAGSVAEALITHAIEAGNFPGSSEAQIAEFLTDWATLPF